MMLRMFPRQYGLENVFVQKNVFTGTSGSRTNKARLNHPWRLRQMKLLVEEMFSMNNRSMTRFIRLRKFENMSLQYVLQGFKMSDCKWLQDERLSKSDSHVSHFPPSASNKQHEILNEFIYWLFDGVLIPLLQASFYVTDSSFHRNRVFYYRHELWQLINKAAVSLIQKEMFIQMKPEEVDICNRAYAKVRLLPKTNDLRPIINLRKRSPKLVNGDIALGAGSINQQLSNAFMIMTYESGRQLSQKTSSAIGMSDLYQRFKLAKEKLVDSSNPNPPKLFMVKVDIRKSFDSINQVKLLEIIDRTLKEAVDPKEMGSFIDFARDQAEVSKHAILVDKVVRTFENKKTVVDSIRDHISNNIVKFGKHFYRQTTGIPQGSMLSPALCRIFYDEMELNTLLDLSSSHDSALLRLADDFLFISQVQEKAETFLKIMSQGHSEYGCYINEKKTITNFDVNLNGIPVQKCQGNDFPYCGLLVHMKSLEIGADYSRYHSEELLLDPVTAIHIQPLALPHITKDIFRACFGLLHSGRRSMAGATAGATFTIAERHVHWLGASAFMRTLPILPIYEPLRAMLRDQILGPIARSEKGHFKRMLHSAANDERNIILNNIQYK
ncbi:hypothetical protein BGZ76_010674 [Entomortierella beljakovae]|nr:hypothetical protein BGZ76_010674 [Entomortierella beljakovae]